MTGEDGHCIFVPRRALAIANPFGQVSVIMNENGQVNAIVQAQAPEWQLQGHGWQCEKNILDTCRQRHTSFAAIRRASLPGIVLWRSSTCHQQTENIKAKTHGL